MTTGFLAAHGTNFELLETFIIFLLYVIKFTFSVQNFGVTANTYPKCSTTLELYYHTFKYFNLNRS